MMKLLLTFTFAFFWAHGASAYNTWEHGRNCYDRIGVEVPRYTCEDGALIPVTENGVVRNMPSNGIPASSQHGGCDNPADGSSHCYPGTRLLTYLDTFTRDGQQETVRTTIICRKGPSDTGRHQYHDIAIIQHNETKNEVCWFNELGNHQAAQNVPPPYTVNDPGGTARRDAEDWWGRDTTTLNCMSCHDGGLYLRTPWVMQVNDQNRGVFSRDGGGRYEAATGRVSGRLPDLGREGLACSVGGAHFDQWNDELPQLIQINASAYNEMRYGDRVPPNIASASTCTQCHYLGFGPGGRSSKTCNLAKEAMGRRANPAHSSFGASFPNAQWMPPHDSAHWAQIREDLAGALSTPGHAVENTTGPIVPEGTPAGIRRAGAANYANYFQAAIGAVEFCCDPSNYDRKVGGEYVCKSGSTRFRRAQNPCGTGKSGGASTGGPGTTRGH